MSNTERPEGTVGTNPLSTLGLLVLAIALIVGSGSYFSSKQKAPEATTAQTTGIFEMVFQSR